MRNTFLIIFILYGNLIWSQKFGFIISDEKVGINSFVLNEDIIENDPKKYNNYLSKKIIIDDSENSIKELFLKKSCSDYSCKSLDDIVFRFFDQSSCVYLKDSLLNKLTKKKIYRNRRVVNTTLSFRILNNTKDSLTFNENVESNVSAPSFSKSHFENEGDFENLDEDIISNNVEIILKELRDSLTRTGNVDIANKVENGKVEIIESHGLLVSELSENQFEQLSIQLIIEKDDNYLNTNIEIKACILDGKNKQANKQTCISKNYCSEFDRFQDKVVYLICKSLKRIFKVV